MSGVSNNLRVFRACRALLAPSKSSSISASSAKTDPKPAKATRKAKNPTTSSSSAATTKRVPTAPTGILKVTQVSPALGKFLGVSEASRTDAVKQIWSYIKLHNLQNPADKRVIHCDENLKAIFDGREKVGFLEIGKLLSHHFVKTN